MASRYQPYSRVNHLQPFEAMCCQMAGPSVSGVEHRDTRSDHVFETKALHSADKASAHRPMHQPANNDSTGSVSGKLASCLDFWKNTLEANDYILNIIQHGYVIPFVTLPGRCELKNNLSSLNSPQFVRSEIQNLLSKGYIEEQFHPAYCCNPLTVANGSKKPRLVIDLRHVNPHVQYMPVRYDDWSMLSQTLESDNFFVSFDLTSAYHHVSIAAHHRKYLGFSYHWDTPSGPIKRYFVFKNLCFGLSSACHLFPKLTRPLVTAWRSSGINCYMYLDDGAAVFRTYLDAQRGSQLLQSYLQQSGFQVNSKKSRWQPSQQLEWLGFNFDSTNMKISVNEAKSRKLSRLALFCYQNKRHQPGRWLV